MENEASFKEKLNAAENATHSDSSLQIYETLLDIKFREFKGKKILDVGGKPNGKFATEAKKLGINIFTLNPAERSIGSENNIGVTVRGFAQDMPFPENTFDLVIVLGVTDWFVSKKDYVELASELIRVLKPGGKAIIQFITGYIQGVGNIKAIFSERESGEIKIDFSKLPDNPAKPKNQQKLYKVTILKTKQ